MRSAGRTLFEKILGGILGKPVHAGETLIAPVQSVLLQDGTAPRVFDRLRALGAETLERQDSTTLYIDHGAPPSSEKIARRQSKLCDEALELGIAIRPAGSGISHQCMVEEVAGCAQLIVGADSHTCMAGALGNIALGMGSTDIACAIAMGVCWLQVPESALVELHGAFEEGVVAKDLMLQLIGRLGAPGANYESLEFGGDGLASLSMDDRFVLANMAAEVGAKTGLMPTDECTREFLVAHGRGAAFRELSADADARYDRHLRLNLSRQSPMVALPGRHDDTVPVENADPERMDQVVIGSCTNGRSSDFEEAAKLLRGHRIHPRTRLILAPASRRVLAAAMASGAMGQLIDAGGTLVTPGCGPCVGIHQGVLGKEQNCIATQSRNFPGRMGHDSSRVWLASPLTAAASAVTGRLTDPRELIHGA